MDEQISIRRQLRAGVVVTVTWKDGPVRVQWAEQVLGPTPVLIESAVSTCRRNCQMLLFGVRERSEER
jgi:hypothetical protein